MNAFKKSLLIATVLLGAITTVLADKGGVAKKGKNKAKLNITMPSTLRNSIGFNLRNGLVYKGSFNTDKNLFTGISVSTFQKGNTIYIIPYKRKIVVADIQQGYTGVKLIIKPRK